MVAEEVRREAAIWSSRLLPFAKLLPNTLEVEDLVLSVLSELSTDDFLTDVLAFCFPMASVEGRGTVTTNTKLRRIMMRLRSTAQCVSMETKTAGSATETDGPQLLSAKYQLVSRAVLTNRSKVLGGDEPGSPHRDFLMAPEGGVVVHEKDLNVGVVLFEYDMEYLCFLDIFLTMILPHSVFTERPMNPSRQLVPYLSEFHNGGGGGGAADEMILTSDGPVACTLYPILNSLIRWAHMPYPQKTQETKSTKESSRRSSRRKMAKRRSKLNVCSMRVNLSIPVIIGCLREQEGAVSKDVTGSGEVPGGTGSGDVTRSGRVPGGTGSGDVTGSGKVPGGAGSRDLSGGAEGRTEFENLPAQNGSGPDFSRGKQPLAKEKEAHLEIPAEKRQVLVSRDTHQRRYVPEGHSQDSRGDGSHMHMERGSGSRAGGKELTETSGANRVEVGGDLRLLEVPEGVLQVSTRTSVGCKCCIAKMEPPLYNLPLNNSYAN